MSAPNSFDKKLADIFKALGVEHRPAFDEIRLTEKEAFICLAVLGPAVAGCLSMLSEADAETWFALIKHELQVHRIERGDLAPSSGKIH